MAVPGFLTAWAPFVRSLLRIISGILFMLSGTQKMFAFPIGIPNFPTPPPTGSLSWWAGALEVVLGALIVLGLLTRIASFLASGEMAVAYFVGHAGQSFWPTINQGTLAVLYCWLFFYFVFAGPGPLSIDALFTRKRA